jgi:hypothetical protein
MVDRRRPTLAHVYAYNAAVSQSQIHACSASTVESHSINGKRWTAGSNLRGNLALYDHVGIEWGALLRCLGTRLRLLRLSLHRSAGRSTDCLLSRFLQGGTAAHQGNHADVISPQNVSSHEMNLHPYPAASVAFCVVPERVHRISRAAMLGAKIATPTRDIHAPGGRRWLRAARAHLRSNRWIEAGCAEHQAGGTSSVSSGLARRKGATSGERACLTWTVYRIAAWLTASVHC